MNKSFYKGILIGLGLGMGIHTNPLGAILLALGVGLHFKGW